MSFPRYPDYRWSEFDWLGHIPEHWEVAKFRHCFVESSEKIEQNVVGQMLSVSGYRGIEIKEYDDDNRRRSEEDLVGYRIARVGQLVVNTMWLNYAGLGVSMHEGHVSPAYRCYWINQRLIRRYVHHLMRSDFYVRGYTKYLTGVRPNSLQMSRDDLMAFPVIVPPCNEQEVIATFLDRETAKIDALIAEQQRLIDLLKEKRQAVISHAVTKGLNPEAPMKDSGIEWLGEVPAHWEVMRIKFVIDSVKAGPFGSALTKDVYVNSGYRIYGQEQVIPNDFSIGDYFITPEKYEELSQYSVSPGDVLISCVGTFGKIAIVPSGIEPGIINPRLIRLRCSKAIKAEYLVEVMRSNVTFEQLSSFTRGGTMDVINIGTLNEIFVALPPMSEQDYLLCFLQHEISKFDTLTTEAQHAIDLLQERRTALISAAVTGQIDVREAD